MTKSRDLGNLVSDGASSGVAVYATISAMTDVASPSAGDLAYVTANTSLYQNNGNGWYRIAEVNSTPAVDSVSETTSGSTTTLTDNGTFTLTAGANTVVTITASDPDPGTDLTYSHHVTGTASNVATITQGSGATENVFTFAPASATGGTLVVRFDVTDNTNTAQFTNSFTLSFDMTGTQQARLISSDAAAWDNQGWEVDIDGDTAVVGTRNKEAVYVYVRSGTSWSQQAKLTASDGASGDQFGIDVGVSGDYIVVGAKQDDDAGTNSGSAYVFVRSGTTWTQQQKLAASNAQTHDGFGASVDIDGSSILVGAPFEDTGGTNFGTAYVFTRSGTTWSQQQEINPSGTSGDFYGYFCAIEGDNAVVGAYGHNPTDKGRAFVWTRSGTTWTQQAALNASDAANYDRFGHGVSISGDTIVCGAYQEDTTASDAGAVYIFTRSGTTWSQQQKIQSSDISANDNFGFSVAVDGDTLIAGARYQDTGSNNAGAAYIFTRSGSTWTQAHKIQASTVTYNGYFGSAVALSGKTGIIGEYLLEHNSVNSGGAYIFV